MTNASYLRQVKAHEAAIGKLNAAAKAEGITVPRAKAGRNGKGQFQKAVAPKAVKVEAPKVTVAPREIVIRDPGSPATFRQRKYLAKLEGSFPKGDMTKAEASERINAALSAAA